MPNKNHDARGRFTTGPQDERHFVREAIAAAAAPLKPFPADSKIGELRVDVKCTTRFIDKDENDRQFGIGFVWGMIGLAAIEFIVYAVLS